MKTIEGSLRGRGGQGRGRGRGGRGGHSDPRFGGRLQDPQFQPMRKPKAENRQRQNVGQRYDEILKKDPRFMKSKVDSVGRRRREVEQQYEDVSSEDHEEDVEDDWEEESQEEEAISYSDPEMMDATHRLAVVKCDWNHVRAADLFAVFFHSLPLGGKLNNVKVYLSDFGKERLAHEKQHGPDLWVKPGDEGYEKVDEENKDYISQQKQIALELAEEKAQEKAAKKTKKKISGDSDDDVEDSDYSSMDEKEILHGGENEDGDKFSSGKFRQYEMDRMKYYYAIAEFDSLETAACVYSMCDGVDIEASGVFLDLRYVPDEESFKGQKPVDTSTAIPPNFRPLKAFKNAAATQTKFAISWDCDDPGRRQSFRDAFDDDTDGANLAAYMASDSDSEGDEDDDDDTGRKGSKASKRAKQRAKIRSKYAALLDGLIDENEGANGEVEDEGEDDELNRLSDIEMNDDSDDGDDEEDQAPEGEMEATMDIDAEDKAALLQRQMAKQLAKKKSTLGEQHDVKHKERRKEAKKQKKMEYIAEKEKSKERAKEKMNSAKERQKLRRDLGDAVEDLGEKKTGKQKKKEHALVTKQKAREDRAQQKKVHLLDTLGGGKGTKVEHLSTETTSLPKRQEEGSIVDKRFDSRLISDPRFHLDVSADKHRRNLELAKVAGKVAKARVGAGSAEHGEGGKVDATVDYFVNRGSEPQRKRKRLESNK